MAPSSYFADNYGEKLTNALRVFSDKCWKRAALIIGLALAGYDSVLRPEDLSVSLPENLRKSVVESLGDVLGKCEIDDYLLVGDKIQPLIMNLVLNNTRVLTEAFIDKYNEAINEVRRVLNIARDRGVIYVAERLYWLGLASIIANAAESGKSIKPGDADIVLDLALSAIQYVASPNLIIPILRALRPLRNKAPQRYLKLLASASGIGNLDSGTVRYVLNELNEVLDNYGDVVRGYAWSLVHAIRAYANLLRGYLIYISDEVEGAVRRVTDLLNELGRFKTSLGVIAWAYALDPALIHENVRGFMEKALGIDATSKANEVLEELSRLRKGVQELISDEEFRSYVESMYIKTDEKAVKKVILEAASHLKHALAIYRLYNDELDEAKKLSNEAAEEYREIGDYENYLITRGWALRAEAIKGSLVGDELVKKFQRLYEETFNEEYFMPTALYLSFAPGILGEYLVSLALTGDHETINELLEEHWLVLRINEQVSVLTRLMINALLRPKDRKDQLGSELKDKLGIDSRELINAFGSDIYMYIEFLPALRVALGITRPKDETAVCMLINDSTKRMDCMYAISVAMNDNAAVVQLRGWLINRFQGLLFEKLGLLKELGANADELFNEFKGLVNGLDGKSLVQLIAPISSMAGLALMLHALVNGNEKLAKAHALMGAAYATDKLITRLYLEAYRACCDLGKDEFRRAIAKLFFYHV
jgi:tetratricopeptide (TPR) repeat protein